MNPEDIIYDNDEVAYTHIARKNKKRKTRQIACQSVVDMFSKLESNHALLNPKSSSQVTYDTLSQVTIEEESEQNDKRDLEVIINENGNMPSNSPSLDSESQSMSLSTMSNSTFTHADNSIDSLNQYTSSLVSVEIAHEYDRLKERFFRLPPGTDKKTIQKFNRSARNRRYYLKQKKKKELEQLIQMRNLSDSNLI